ncbi:MAG: nucleotide exchange factor GrpE [Methylococcaceae bacterium]|nr:nucleotide exchange factor GrpE [Methylococcaceae bacterium]
MSDEKASKLSVEEDISGALEEPAESQPKPVEHGSDPESVSAELLASQLDDARKEARDNWEQLLRARAELDNLRRRTQKELQDAHKFALERFAKELLPVLDSLEMGIEAASFDSAVNEIVKLREGAELTLRQFKSVLEKFNIETLDPIGDVFNPERHQAMALEPNPEVDANTIIRVFQKGYLLNQRLLRPALVLVSQAQDPVKIDEQA